MVLVYDDLIHNYTYIHEVNIVSGACRWSDSFVCITCAAALAIITRDPCAFSLLNPLWQLLF